MLDDLIVWLPWLAAAALALIGVTFVGGWLAWRRELAARRER